MTPLDDEQKEYVRLLVSQYVYLASGGKVTCADADHSALLARLLNGNKIFEKPPPLYCAYPCYALAEGLPFDLIEAPWDNDPSLGEFPVVIGGHAHWRWKDRSAGILEHKGGDLYRCWWEGKGWWLQRINGEAP